MRSLVFLSLLLLAGCTSAAYRIQPVKLVAGNGPITTCYVHHMNGTRIVDARLIRVGSLWTVTGDVRGAWSARPHHHRVKVEAVDAGEALVLGTLSPAANRDNSRWTFHLPIPDPTTFDHLHLAVVTLDEALVNLPPHDSTHD
jgi:hypothetical protein